jgi:hypothetical protein
MMKLGALRSQSFDSSSPIIISQGRRCREFGAAGAFFFSIKLSLYLPLT